MVNIGTKGKKGYVYRQKHPDKYGGRAFEFDAAPEELKGRTQRQAQKLALAKHASKHLPVESSATG